MKTLLAIFIALMMSAGSAGASLTCAAGGSSAPPTVWNSADKSGGMNLGGDDLSATDLGPSYDAVRGSVGASAGQLYFEVHVTALGGHLGVGVETSAMPLSAPQIAAGNWVWFRNWDTTAAIVASATSASASTWANGDYLGVAVNFSTGNVWFSKNGAWISGDPAAGTSPSLTGASGTLFPFVTMYGYSATTVVANFGATGFHSDPPSGFSAWSEPATCEGHFVCAAATSESCSSWVDAFADDTASFEELGLTGEAIGLAFAIGCGLVLALWGLSLAFGSVSKIINRVLGSP